MTESLRAKGQLFPVVAASGENGAFVLPEHEEEFQRTTPSRRLLEQAFLRLGNGARGYYDGLCAQRSRELDDYDQMIDDLDRDDHAEK